MKMPQCLQSSLRNRFLLAMGVMLLPLVVLAVVVLLALQSTISVIDDVVEEATRELAFVLRLHIQVQRVSLSMHDYLTHGPGDPGARHRFLQASREADSLFRGVAMAPFALAEERALVRAAQEEWQRSKDIGESLLDPSRRLWETAATQDLSRLDAHIERALGLLNQVHELTQGEMDARLDLAHRVRRRVLFIILAVFALGVAAVILVDTLLARSILRPLHALEQGADRIGAGDLSHRVDVLSRDELGQVGRTFNVMAERLAKSQSILEELSTQDPLTGLYNYRVFHSRLAEEEERSRRYAHPFSLLMLDIDHFKTINDTHGHLAGDEALRAVAGLIRQEVRPVDLVTRYGGEEFALILPETSSAGALATAERIREIIAAHPIFLTSGQAVTLTASIGVATYPEAAGSAERLISAADQALYRAKAGGRNQVCCSDGVSERAGPRGTGNDIGGVVE
ncbi:MAG TPA: diguanylate cyclase [Candidatus Methylomirabilis sp.]|nr:diguanylate cyclase [Candidatus Methylomirabilis sp.]